MNKTVATELLKLAKELVEAQETVAAINEEVKTAAGMNLSELPKEIQAKVLDLIDSKKKVEGLKASLKKAVGTLESELRSLDKKVKLLDTELAPVLKDCLDGIITCEKGIIKYDPQKSKQPKYAQAFEEALSKVNEATRRVLEQAVEASKGISSYLDVTITASETESPKMVKAGLWSFLTKTWDKVLGLIAPVKSAQIEQQQAVDQFMKVL